MKILLPTPNFKLCAKLLSNQHVKKQAVQVAIALRVLHQTASRPTVERFWDDPYVCMWRGHEAQLAEYGITLCEEMKSRSIDFAAALEDEMYIHLAAAVSGNTDKPAWWGNVELHISHKAALLREDFQYYQPFFYYVSQDLEMVWPV